MRYHIAVNGETIGSAEPAELAAWFDAGKFSLDDYAWAEGWPEWKSVKDCLELINALAGHLPDPSQQEIDTLLAALDEPKTSDRETTPAPTAPGTGASSARPLFCGLYAQRVSGERILYRQEAIEGIDGRALIEENTIENVFFLRGERLAELASIAPLLSLFRDDDCRTILDHLEKRHGLAGRLDPFRLFLVENDPARAAEQLRETWKVQEGRLPRRKPSPEVWTFEEEAALAVRLGFPHEEISTHVETLADRAVDAPTFIALARAAAAADLSSDSIRRFLSEAEKRILIDPHRFYHALSSFRLLGDRAPVETLIASNVINAPNRARFLALYFEDLDGARALLDGEHPLDVEGLLYNAETRICLFDDRETAGALFERARGMAEDLLDLQECARIAADVLVDFEAAREILEEAEAKADGSIEYQGLAETWKALFPDAAEIRDLLEDAEETTESEWDFLFCAQAWKETADDIERGRTCLERAAGKSVEFHFNLSCADTAIELVDDSALARRCLETAEADARDLPGRLAECAGRYARLLGDVDKARQLMARAESLIMSGRDWLECAEVWQFDLGAHEDAERCLAEAEKSKNIRLLLSIIPERIHLFPNGKARARQYLDRAAKTAKDVYEHGDIAAARFRIFGERDAALQSMAEAEKKAVHREDWEMISRRWEEVFSDQDAAERCRKKAETAPKRTLPGEISNQDELDGLQSASDDGKSAASVGPQRPVSRKSRKRKLLVWGAVLLLIYLAANYVMGLSRTLYVVNGLNRAYTVEVNGRSIALAPFGAAVGRVVEGDLLVRVPDPAMGIPDRVVRYHNNFWWRIFTFDFTPVLNPDGAAILVIEERTYYRDRPTVDEAPEAFPPQFIHVLRNKHYTAHRFEPLPSSISFSSDDSDQKTLKGLRVLAFPIDPIWFKTLEPAVGRETLEEIVLTRIPREADPNFALPSLGLFSSAGKIDAAFKPFLDLIPTNVTLHRTYQELMILAGAETEAIAYYRQRQEKNPDDAHSMYLLGRILPDHEEARAWFAKSIEGAASSEYGFFGLGAFHLARGDYDSAVAFASVAVDRMPEAPWSLMLIEMALEGRRDYDRLLQWNAANRLQDYHHPFEREVMYLALAGRETEAREAIERNLSTLADTEPKEPWRIRMEMCRRIAARDTVGYLELAGDSPPRRFMLEAALLAGRLDDAATMIEEESSGPVMRLLVYAAAKRAGREDLAAEQMAAALEAFGREGGMWREIKSWFESDSPPARAAVIANAIWPQEKRLIALALAARFPDRKAEFLALARKFNIAPLRHFLYVSEAAGAGTGAEPPRMD